MEVPRPRTEPKPQLWPCTAAMARLDHLSQLCWARNRTCTSTVNELLQLGLLCHCTTEGTPVHFFINKVLLELSHTLSFRYYLCLLCCHNRVEWFDPLSGPQVCNIYWLAFYRNHLLILGLETIKGSPFYSRCCCFSSKCLLPCFLWRGDENEIFPFFFQGLLRYNWQINIYI